MGGWPLVETGIDAIFVAAYLRSSEQFNIKLALANQHRHHRTVTCPFIRCQHRTNAQEKSYTRRCQIVVVGVSGDG